MPERGQGSRGGSAPPDDGLARLAERALGLIRAGDAIGLGSGQTVAAFLRALAGRVRGGLQVRGVPTSEATAALARQLGIPLADLDDTPLAMTVDGADEVDPRLDLIKGYGGALVRERIVAAASRRQVILVEAEKLVPVLGTRGRLPVEVVPFALPLCRRRLEALGCPPRVRQADDRPARSDNGNLLLDCAVGPLEEPAALEREIRAIPGVVDTGLFLGTAETVFVAEGDGIRVLQRARGV